MLAFFFIRDTQRLDIPIETTGAHESIIHTVDGVNGSARELVTGSRDGLVKVWDTRQLQSAVATVRSQPQGNKGPTNEVWAVAFGKSMIIIIIITVLILIYIHIYS